MAKAFGIVNFAGNHIAVEGMQEYRPVGAFSFLGRYRVIDFTISNMSNSGIDHIQVYIRRKPQSLTAHLGTGRHYNINSKSGNLQILYSGLGMNMSLYNNDIASYIENLEYIEQQLEEYVVIAPSYMIYTQDYNCYAVNLNKQKGVLSLEQNHGNAKNKNIFMDTYIMKKDLFIELIHKSRKTSSVYTLLDIVNASCEDLDIRGVSHRGYFAAISDFNSYYESNLSLTDIKTAQNLFVPDWPIYTKTNDSCPTQYFETGTAKNSVVSNGCLIEGEIDHSVIGRGCIIKKGAVVKNCIVLSDAYIGENVHVENQVIDKHAKITHAKELSASEDRPGYVRRNDTL